MVKADQLQLVSLMSRKGHTGEVSGSSREQEQQQQEGAGWHAQCWGTHARSQLRPLACGVHAPDLTWTGQQVWKGTLWGKPVAVKVLPLMDVEQRQLECLRREVAVLLHTTGECKQVGEQLQLGGGGARAARQ